MLQAMILDFDGVIADTEKLHLRAFQDALGRRGIVLGAPEYYQRYLGLDDAGVLRALPAQRGIAEADARVDEMLREKAARYAELTAGADVLFDGIDGKLRAWSAHVPLAIASGSLRAEIERILGRHDLLGCFTAIISADDVARGKPAPDSYLAALESLNRARQESLDRIDARRVVALEDSIPGIHAARTAGLRTVAIASNHPPAALSLADLVVSSMSAIDLRVLAELVARQ